MRAAVISDTHDLLRPEVLEQTFVEEVCMIRVTHPGVTANGILINKSILYKRK